MRRNIYKHSIDLKKISIPNTNRDDFAKLLIDLPYRGYEVEEIADGRKIVITKPGGKSSYGSLKKDDFLVFIYNPNDETLWQITHKQIQNDITVKAEEKPKETKNLLGLFEKVYNGEEPNDFLQELRAFNFQTGESPEALIKAYKWIWGQEDVNYPAPKLQGRALAWKTLKEIMDSL